MLSRQDTSPSALGTPQRAPSAATKSGLRERVLERLQSTHGRWIIAAVALALSLPALRLGLSTDDHVLRWKSQLGVTSLFALPHEAAIRGRYQGMLAWWSSPELAIEFLRPLSALTHVIEFRAWPDAVWAMHLVSSLLYAALAVVVWLLYRELLPGNRRLAALAALLFAIDDGHAGAVGWISSRNSVLAQLFALGAVLLHVRARKLATVGDGEASPAGAQMRRLLGLHGASAVCVGLALLSAEAGVSALAYLLAYAVVFESGTIRHRVVSLSPQLCVFASWVALYIGGGFGTHGASFYRDLSSPLSTLGLGLLDVPSWLLGLFGPNLLGITLVMAELPARLLACVLVLPILVALYLALPRTRENAFFGLGALLCLPALFATLPQDRLLIAAGVGGFGLIASFIAQARQSRHRYARGMRGVLIALHLVVSPLAFIPALNQGGPIENGSRALAQATASTAPQAIVVNSPIELLSLYASQQLAQRPEGERPRALHQLYVGGSRLEAQRIDANTLELRAAKGWGRSPIERIFCAERDLPPAGSKLKVDGMRIAVLESDEDGHPMRVQFRFPSALEASERRWFSWQGTQPAPWQPPAIGQTVSLAPLSIFTALRP